MRDRLNIFSLIANIAVYSTKYSKLLVLNKTFFFQGIFKNFYSMFETARKKELIDERFYS